MKPLGYIISALLILAVMYGRNVGAGEIPTISENKDQVTNRCIPCPHT